MIYNTEMAEYAKGVAQFLGSLLSGQYVTKEQIREAMDNILASAKWNIEFPLCILTTKRKKHNLNIKDY